MMVAAVITRTKPEEDILVIGTMKKVVPTDVARASARYLEHQQDSCITIALS
jgi:hypothetical protein